MQTAQLRQEKEQEKYSGQNGVEKILQIL